MNHSMSKHGEEHQKTYYLPKHCFNCSFRTQKKVLMNSLLCSTCWISDITLHYIKHHPPGSDKWMHNAMLMKCQRRRDSGENCSNQGMHMSMLPRREFYMKQEASIVRNVLFIYITSLYCNFSALLYDNCSSATNI